MAIAIAFDEASRLGVDVVAVIVIGVDGSLPATAAARWASVRSSAAQCRTDRRACAAVGTGSLAADGMAGDPTIGRGRRRPNSRKGRPPCQSSPRPSVRGDPAVSPAGSASARSYQRCRLQPQGIADDRGWAARPKGDTSRSARLSQQRRAAPSAARSRWSTTTCHWFHRAQHRVSWALTARPSPSHDHHQLRAP
jgi:hypothetical protein